MTEKEAVNVAKILQAVGRGVPGRVAGIPGAVGGFALNTARRAGNVLGSGVAQLARPGIHPSNSPGLNKVLNSVATNAERLGSNTVGALQRGVARMTGMRHTSKFNPLNVATGAGILGGGYSALRGSPSAAKPGPAAPAAPAAGGGGFGGLSQRGMAMWNGLPVEARYAIGAGVPLALLGGYMGRKGGRGGLGLGALGLGAAALGGASGGMFGDNARRATGKMLYNVGSFFGGGGDDPRSQINMLSKLSPELGATVLMGRDSNLSAQDARQQYDFLTQNSDMIHKLLPSLAGKSASALFKDARCWKGYEPVPGKAPYSEDSCRPVGKKKKKEKKAEFSIEEFAHSAPNMQSIAHNKAAKATTAFKLTKKEHEEVVAGGKPSGEAAHHNVTPRDPSEGENLRPHGALVEPDEKPESD